MWFDPAQLMQNADAPFATLATSATFSHLPSVNDGKVARIAKVATPLETKTANPDPVDGSYSLLATYTDNLEQQPDGSNVRIKSITAQLESDPGLIYTMKTHNNTELEVVILTLAIRGKGACELRIPKSRYDGLAMLELIEKHTTRETLQCP